MKKVLLLSLVALAIAGALPAETFDLTIESWARAAFAPLMIQGDKYVDGKWGGGFDYFTGTGSTLRDDIAIEVTARGSADYAGFELGLRFGTELKSRLVEFSPSGANIWVKPFSSDLLKITAGRFTDAALRGTVGEVNGGFEYFSLAPFKRNPGSTSPRQERELFTWDEDQIFSQFEAGLGFMVSSSPVPGLYLGASVDAPGIRFHRYLDAWSPDPATSTPTINEEGPPLAEDAYTNVHIGAGYQIEGLGHARLQWIGGYLGQNGPPFQSSPPYTEDSPDAAFFDPAWIEAAFAFTRIEGLILDIGFKAALPVTDVAGSGKSYKGFAVSVGGRFESGDFGISGRADSTFGAYREYYHNPSYGYFNPYRKENESFIVGVRLSPYYKLDLATVGIDVGCGVVGESTTVQDGSTSKDKNNQFHCGFGLYAKRDLGAYAHIMTGVSYTMIPLINNGAGMKPNGHSYFRIPVLMEFSFK